MVVLASCSVPVGGGTARRLTPVEPVVGVVTVMEPDFVHVVPLIEAVSVQLYVPAAA
jgi:hypothetical protein